MKKEKTKAAENQQDEVWTQVKAKIREAHDSEINSCRASEARITNFLQGNSHQTVATTGKSAK